MLWLRGAGVVIQYGVEQEVCYHGAIVAHSYPDYVVELALVESSRFTTFSITGATRGSEDVVFSAVVNVPAVCVPMAGEDRIRSLTEHLDELLPVVEGFGIPPERLVQENHRPSNVVVCIDDSTKILELLMGDMTAVGVFGIHTEDQDVAIGEVIIASAKSSLPHFGH